MSHMKTQKVFLAPNFTVLLVLTIIMINFVQALLLEKINESNTTFRKNLEL